MYNFFTKTLRCCSYAIYCFCQIYLYKIVLKYAHENVALCNSVTYTLFFFFQCYIFSSIDEQLFKKIDYFCREMCK